MEFTQHALAISTHRDSFCNYSKEAFLNLIHYLSHGPQKIILLLILLGHEYSQMVSQQKQNFF